MCNPLTSYHHPLPNSNQVIPYCPVQTDVCPALSPLETTAGWWVIPPLPNVEKIEDLTHHQIKRMKGAEYFDPLKNDWVPIATEKVQLLAKKKLNSQHFDFLSERGLNMDQVAKLANNFPDLEGDKLAKKIDHSFFWRDYHKDVVYFDHLDKKWVRLEREKKEFLERKKLQVKHFKLFLEHVANMNIIVKYAERFPDLEGDKLAEKIENCCKLELSWEDKVDEKAEWDGKMPSLNYGRMLVKLANESVDYLVHKKQLSPQHLHQLSKNRITQAETYAVIGLYPHLSGDKLFEKIMESCKIPFDCERFVEWEKNPYERCSRDLSFDGHEFPRALILHPDDVPEMGFDSNRDFIKKIDKDYNVCLQRVRTHEDLCKAVLEKGSERSIDLLVFIFHGSPVHINLGPNHILDLKSPFMYQGVSCFSTLSKNAVVILNVCNAGLGEKSIADHIFQSTKKGTTLYASIATTSPMQLILPKDSTGRLNVRFWDIKHFDREGENKAPYDATRIFFKRRKSQI